jgi:hypothetical protein
MIWLGLTANVFYGLSTMHWAITARRLNIADYIGVESVSTLPGPNLMN